MIDPTTGLVDENQNNVWNVDLGLTNLAYFSFMEQIGKLLIKKKKIDHKIRILKEKGGKEKEIEKQKKEIKKLQTAAVKIMKKGKDYEENNPAVSQYAYIQF